jgi:hypothetical protein
VGLLAAGLVGVGLVAVQGGAATIGPQNWPSLPDGGSSPPITAGAPAPTPQPNGLRIGLSLGNNMNGLSQAALNQVLNDASTLGVGWLRADLAWDDVQPTSASLFDWSSFDRLVQGAAARHLEVLPMVGYTPAWARPAGCSTPKCAPAHPAQFASFARAAVRRYAPLGVHAWEIWNEPNVEGFWRPAPNPAQYVALLRVTASEIKAADPTATVISGGLAPADTERGSLSPLDFLAKFCWMGGSTVVDAIGYHPYSYPVPPHYDAPWNAWAQMSGSHPSFQSLLSSCGKPLKPIWATEYGAPTNGPGVGATRADYRLAQRPDHVDEQMQAMMIGESVRLAQGSPFIGALFVYTFRDKGTNTRDPENFFGLRRFNGTAKPAYEAFRQAIAAG